MDNKNYSVFFRSFEEDDAKLIHKWKNDFEMFEMTLGMNRKLSLKEVQEWVAEKMKHHHFEVHWAICLNDESQKMIGYTYLSNITTVPLRLDVLKKVKLSIIRRDI